MTFKTGRQFPIGGGSSLVYLGIPLREKEFLHWEDPTEKLCFLIDFNGPKATPPRASRLEVAQMHNKVIRGHLRQYGDDPIVANLFTATESWQRLIFYQTPQSPSGAVKDMEAYCLHFSRQLTYCWKMVEHVEYKWKVTNEEVQDQYPISPQDIRLVEGVNANTGFGRVAAVLLHAVREAGSRAHLSRNWWPLGDNVIERYSTQVKEMESEEFLKIVQSMVRSEHLARIHGQYLFRESFIIACWKRSLGILADGSNII